MQPEPVPGAGAAVREPGGVRVFAVLVTWQRLPLLRESLAAVLGQTAPPDRVLVVDNASADGTAEAVAEVAGRCPQVQLVRLRRNTGGAGGFAVGLDRALADGADLVWLLDDDTVPRPGALAALLAARAATPAPAPALLASRVVWTDGRDHPMNTPRRAPLAPPAARRAAAASGSLPVRSASFVSVLVDAARVRQVGSVRADFFLWNDDFDLTTRLLRGRLGLWCPGSVVEHRTRAFGASDADPGPRFYYEVRNKIWVFTRGGGLGPGERLLYGGATLARWVRTARRSTDRAQLARAFARGCRDGLRRGPRPNDVVLRDAVVPDPTVPGVQPA